MIAIAPSASSLVCDAFPDEDLVLVLSESSLVVARVAVLTPDVVSAGGTLIEVVAVDAPEATDVPEPDAPAAAKVGGGMTAAASSRAPTPHPITAPSGWVSLAGAVVEPSAPANVQRVVQVVLGAPGAVNW